MKDTETKRDCSEQQDKFIIDKNIFISITKTQIKENAQAFSFFVGLTLFLRSQLHRKKRGTSNIFP